MGRSEPAIPSRSLLIVEDNPEAAARICLALAEGSEFQVVHVQTLDAALSVLWSRSVDAVLLDLTLPDSFGMGTAELVLGAAPSVPVVVLAAEEDDATAELALGFGADDYVLNTAPGPVIARALRKAIARRSHLERNAALQRMVGRRSTHDTLSGLPNRYLFTDRLRHALDRTRQYREPLALLTLRVTALPWTGGASDSEAHDAMVAETARRLRAMTRRSDTLARIEDDMFAVILERAASRKALSRHLGDLIRALEVPMPWRGSHVGIRVQPGLAFCPDDGSEGEALLSASVRDSESIPRLAS